MVEKLEKLGLKKVAWTGKCEADRVSLGKYDVPDGEGAMYGLVFDNTFAKQFSKTVTFVLMTYPTGQAPKSGHYMHFAQASSGTLPTSPSGSNNGSPNVYPANDSNDNLARDLDRNKIVLADPRPRTGHGVQSTTHFGGSFYTGVLSKKRRKRNQGYARRFFSLDFTSSTLSYYKNRNSSGLRGAIPLSLAAVATHEKSRIISVDSGTEIWLLRAHNRQDFNGWREALEKASEHASTPLSPTIKADTNQSRPQQVVSFAEEREWGVVESLVGRVSGITDGMRRLAKNTDAKCSPSRGVGVGASDSPTSQNTSDGNADYFGSQDASEKKSFFRRKSNNRLPSPSFRRSVSAGRLAPPSPIPTGSPGLIKRYDSHEDSQIRENCMALLKDLEKVVSEFSTVIIESKQRRSPQRPPPLLPRNSMESTIQEFYDAEEGEEDRTQGVQSPIMNMRRDADVDEDGAERDDDAISINSASTISIADQRNRHADTAKTPSLFPAKPRSLYPLPRTSVPHRTTIPPSKGPPPSLISFLRKNVGKDLSTIAMPVTANEPLSLLQRQAEELESAALLTTAASISSHNHPPQHLPVIRLLHVTTFALSALASSRARERAIRKPFNPMLGETYELTYPSLGFRFLAEKISHHPVRIASQAESSSWSFLHTTAPSQKFWGKSAELISEGRCRVSLFGGDEEAGERYSWSPPQCFLRNIIAGEKYVEPVGSMTVAEESSGLRAVATFKAGGMFSGRSEDVTVAAFEANGTASGWGLEGKWTTELALTHDGQRKDVIWKAPPLAEKYQVRYGLTAFATGLNEITEIEKGALPPSDSRLRPDQRAYEEGKVEEAEALKARLEEAQRRRRGEMERNGESWHPRWFGKVQEGRGEEQEEVWSLDDGGKGGGGNYWDVREAVVGFKGGRWDGVRDVFEL